MCAVIALALTEILCGMARLKEQRETMLSCALEHPEVDLRGTGNHTKYRRTTSERGGKAMWLHTGHRCKQWPTVESHRCTRRGTPTSQTCTHKHADQIWSMTAKISSQAQITNICSLFLRQRPCRSLPQLARLDLVFLKLHKDLYH